MFSFLAWIFWLAVFLGAVVLMGGVLVSDMEADDQKKVDEEKKVNEESEVDEIENYLNTWPATGIFISSLLAAILSSWWMGFLYVLIFFFILLWFSLVYKTLSFFGFEFNNKGSEMVRKFQKEFSANGFTKKYTPIATTIFASFFIATISLYGLDSGSSSSSSSSSASKSYISEIAEGYYVSEAKAREWIDLIGVDGFKKLNRHKNFVCGLLSNSVDCMALGTMDEEVKKEAAKAGCKKDWRKCRTKGEFETSHFGWWQDIGSACAHAANKSEGRDVMKAYGRNPFNSYKTTNSLGQDGKVILYSKDMKYDCSYDLEKKKAKII
mgnify:CR=1 FL=1|tara:strand:- start:6556 stop:7527 length:972 start_codon:yes stop_codon:yes gene_type:complete